MLLAGAVAVVHAAVVLFLVTGGLLALSRPRLRRVHVPVALSVLAVNLAGADCPLTDLELALRERAGAGPYAGGFLGHYLLQPIGVDVHATAAQIGIYTAAVLPNLVAYGLLALRRTVQPTPAG